MRLAVPLATVALAAGLLAGCGDSGSGPAGTGPEGGSGSAGARPEGGTGSQPRAGASSAPAGARARACGATATRARGLRVVAVTCEEGRRVLRAWGRGRGCRPAAGAGRGACTVRSYRCAAVGADRGIAVSCARPGRTVSFLARPAP